MSTLQVWLSRGLLFLVSLFLSGNVLGLHYSSLSVNNGLSSRKALAITKDKKKYTWIATGTNIDRYNGENFISYNLTDEKGEQKKPKGIVCDITGNVFAYTEKYIYKYDALTDGFSILSSIKLLNKESITTIYFCDDNFLWIGTTNGLHIARGDGSTEEVKELNGIKVYCFLSDTKDQYWVGTDSGIVKLSMKNNTSRGDLSINLSALEGIRIESLYYDSFTERLWIGTFSDGLKIFNTSTLKLEYEKEFDFKYPVRKIAMIDSTKIWVGIDGAGIYEFDKYTPSLIKKYNQTSKNKGDKIISNSIYDILSDNSLIWVCTYNAGLMVANKETIQTDLFQQNPLGNNSVNNNHVNTILEDKDSNIWFGTNNGISVYNPHTKRWRQYLQNSNAYAVILSLCQDKNGNIWTGGYANDLSIISPQTGRIVKIKNNTQPKSASSRYVYSIISDSNGNVWYGGVIDNLSKYNSTTKEITHYNLKGINKIVNYNDSILLIGSIKGLVIFNKNTKESVRIDFSKLDKKIVSYPFINSVSIDPLDKNKIWLSTDSSGLISYSLKDKKLECITDKQGLSSNSVYGILFDDEGKIWVSSEYGLNCINRTTNTINVYTQNDGLESSIFNFSAYTKLLNGKMIWGTPNGAIETDPSLVKEVPLQPINLVFEDLTIFNERITVESDNSPLTSSIDDSKKLNLTYQQHSFSFDFINVNYIDSRTLYSWTLEGFDTDWSIPSDNHKAIYTNIPSGKYVLKVKAMDAENKSNEIIREIKIEIANPFWATSYAYILYILLILALIYFLHKIYMNRLEATESDKKISFFINMAHDIRTPLTLIKAPLNEIGEEPLSDSATSALDLAKKNTEKLLNMVTQLLDFQKIEREAMALHIEKTDITEYIENTAANFLMLASEKQIDFSLKLPELPVVGWIDRKKITTILDNLLSNSIKYTPKHGNILLKVVATNKIIVIEIIDDGIGISTIEQKKLFKRFYRAENATNSTETGSGIGLLLTKKMVTLHKGTITFTSVENMGTSFKVEIPIQKEALIVLKL